jgi:beta-fructofuranosidase
VYADGRYHLFFQYLPARTTWGPAVNWGHAVSADLIEWAEQPVALAPEPGEVGCWSGSVVLAREPTLFYTRIVPGDPARGQVARAVGTPDLGTWRRDPAGSVIGGAPPGVVELRDPMVWPAAGGWRMLVGARLAGGAGAALQYHSADLLDWAYDGVVTARPGAETGGVWTGSMWECPQLFALDGTWVLLLSVLDGKVPQHVAYGLGDYDGLRFTALTWGAFSHGDQMYATTTFQDAAGRRCVMSWLRERDNAAPPGSPWSGALSLPWVLHVDGDRLIATPHPKLSGSTSAEVVVEEKTVTAIGDLTVSVDESVTLREGARTLLRMPGSGRARVIIDADLIEVTVDGLSGIGVARRPPR